MKKTNFKILFLLGLIAISNPYFLFSQQTELGTRELPYYDPSKKFSVSLYALRVSSAELMDNIRSNEPLFKDLSIELAGGYGYGAELTYDPHLYDLGIILYVSSEFLKIRDDGLVATQVYNDTTVLRVRFIEEFKMFPLEAGIKWNLPVGTDKFKIYIGGGGGIYFGERKRTITGVSTEHIKSTPGFSLNVLSGVEYYIARNLSVDFKFKFREGSFEDESEFPRNVPVFSRNIYSRIIVDGVRISAGLKYNF